MAALQVVGGLSPSPPLASPPLRPRRSSSLLLHPSQCISKRIRVGHNMVHTYESALKLKPKVDVRTNYSHRIQEALEDACVNVPRRQRQFNARICASLDSGEGKTDDARKALEQMFQGKTSLSKKWEEEIKKRELGERDGSGGSGGGGGGGGRGWGGGSDDMDGDSGGQEEPWDWEEAGQTFMATFALIIFYFSITHGPKQVFRLFRLFFRYVRQGFTLKSIPKEFLDGPDTEDEEDEEDEDNGDEDSVLYSDEGRPSKLEPYVSVSDVPRSHVQDNHERHQEPEMDTMGKDSQLTEPPPQYKKGSRMAALQAQQKEKAMQYLADRDRRERGK